MAATPVFATEVSKFVAGSYTQAIVGKRERLLLKMVDTHLASASDTWASKTLTSPVINGTITSSADDVVWTLKANDADALQIGAAAVQDLINIDTRTGADKVTINGDLTVTGDLVGSVDLNIDQIYLEDVTTPAYDLEIIADSSAAAMSANRSLTFDVNNANRMVDLSGDLVLGADFTTTIGTVAFAADAGGSSSLTLPATGTLARISGETFDDVVGLDLRDATTVAYTLGIVADSSAVAMDADKTLTIDVNNANRMVDLKGDIVLAGNLTTAAALTQAGAFATTLTSTAACDLTLPASSSGKLMGFAKASIGYAALNSAGTGVAVPVGDVIPAGAVVIRAWANVTEGFETDNNEATTIKVGIEDQDDDVQVAASINGAPWSGVAKVQFSQLVYGTPDITEFIVVSADRQVAVTGTLVGTDTAFNAGAADIYVEYVY